MRGGFTRSGLPSLLAEIEIVLFDPAEPHQQKQRQSDRHPDDRPCGEPACDPERGRDPDCRRRGQPFDRLPGRVAQNHPGADEADPRYDALYDALHHADQSVGMIRQALEMDRRERDHGRAERYQPERAHADRLIGKIAVDADQNADEHGRREPQRDIEIVEGLAAFQS